jgi:TetR/AcrR family tetracycline transcriptional repressor
MKNRRDEIVNVALSLLNDGGLDALSTRSIAERLKIQQPALYWHFRNKRELLGAMSAEILRRGHRRKRPRPGENWQDFLRANGQSFRQALVAFRDGARVHAGSEPDPANLDDIVAQPDCLVEAGFTPQGGMEVLVAIGRYVVGCVLEEQAEVGAPQTPSALDAAASAYPNLSAAIAYYRRSGHTALFEAGLELLVMNAGKKRQRPKRKRSDFA